MKAHSKRVEKIGLNDSELYATERGVSLGLYPDRQVVAVTGKTTLVSSGEDVKLHSFRVEKM